MHVVVPIVPRLSRARQQPPLSQTGDEREDEQLLLAEQLSESEGIPLDVAYSIVSRHQIVLEGTK